MTRTNANLRNGTIIGTLGLLLALGLAACNERQRTTPPPRTPDSGAARPEAKTPGAQTSNREQAEAAKPPSPAVPATPPRPWSPQEIEALWMQPELASESYGTRLEAVRSIFHRLRNRGQLEEAKIALGVLLDTVENEEGLAMAQRVAFAEAGNLETQQDHRAAVMAYQLLLDRYPGGTFAAEAQYHLGGTYLELHDYTAAEQTWWCLIEQHDDSPFAPWGWRKLALAQLLQGQIDTSLATLELMAAKYPGTEFEDYARMRRGYVYVVAGRTAEAQAAFEAFLAQYPHSVYVRLVRQQLAALEPGAHDGSDVLARVNGPYE